MARLAGKLWRASYARYVAASVMALGVDMTMFLLLQANGAAVGPAAGASYAAGVAAHWLASSRLAFAGSLRDAGVDRLRQQVLFVLSAAAGLAITVTVVTAGAAIGLDARVAKVVAVGVSFQATFLLRSRIVFA